MHYYQATKLRHSYRHKPISESRYQHIDSRQHQLACYQAFRKLAKWPIVSALPVCPSRRFSQKRRHLELCSVLTTDSLRRHNADKPTRSLSLTYDLSKKLFKVMDGWMDIIRCLVSITYSKTDNYKYFIRIEVSTTLSTARGKLNAAIISS